MLVERGWFVYAGARRAVEELAAGPSLCPLALDVRDPASIAAAVARIDAERDGRLDAVVHQAGIAVGGAIGYARGQWTALTRFVEDASLPLDNNASERALRAIALGRKNYLFVGNHSYAL